MKVQTMKTEMKKIDKKDFLRGIGLELTNNISNIGLQMISSLSRKIEYNFTIK